MSNSETVTAFPHTVFTPHVVQLLQQIDLRKWNNVTHGDVLHFRVATPYSAPTVIDGCQSPHKLLRVPRDEKDFEEYLASLARQEYCFLLQDLFDKTRAVLPYNISLVFSEHDVDENVHFDKLRNSAPNGNFCMPNIMEIRRFRYNETFKQTIWENRNKIPIWRGSAWIFDKNIDEESNNNSTNNTSIMDRVLSSPPYRLKAVDWSMRNPLLLDARIGSDLTLNTKIWNNNATNGLHRFLPIHPISQPDYYSHYQVALVLGGIGAAFRTSIHLSTGTAVVLQEYNYKEWFTNLMEPYVNYIPLADDLSDLKDKMVWIRDHPRQVKEIAQRGHEFYETYLSLERNQEHFYEFLYRLSLYQQSGQLPEINTNDNKNMQKTAVRQGGRATNIIASTSQSPAIFWWIFLFVFLQIGLLGVLHRYNQRRKRSCKEN